MLSSNIQKPDLYCLIDGPPRNSFQGIGQSKGSLHDRIENARRRLVQKSMSRMLPDVHIRGNRIASDCLLNALVRYGRQTHPTFVVPPSSLENVEHWCAEIHERFACPKPQIVSRDTVLRTESMKENQCIWLHLDGNSSTPIRLRSATSGRFPTVSLQHGLSMHWLRYEHFLRLLMMPMQPSDVIVCTSAQAQVAFVNIMDDIRRFVEDRTRSRCAFKGEIVKIPLCVDTDYYRPGNKSQARHHLGLKKDDFIILYVGYISAVKAELSALCPVIRELQSEGIKIHLLIAGTGPDKYRHALQHLFNEMKLSTTIKILDNVSDPEKLELLQAADVFLGPCESLQEAFGLAPVEAMSCGLPQVVSDWSGYRETVVDGETGYRVPTYWIDCQRDTEATGEIYGWVHDHVVQGQSIAFDQRIMRERLSFLARTESMRRRMAEASRKRAVEKFSYPAISSQYDDLFRHLVTAASPNGASCSRTIDMPAYFESFKHFATSIINNDSRLSLSNSIHVPLQLLIKVAVSNVDDQHIVDIELIENLVSQAALLSQKEHTFSVGELSLATKCEPNDTVRRHIMFLVKHGWLLPAS